MRATALAALLMLTACPATAPAHDDAQWVQDQGWKNEAGQLCCGKNDCAMLDKDDVETRPTGYYVKSRKLTVPYSKALPSINGRYWMCVWGGEVKCFFAGPSGV